MSTTTSIRRTLAAIGIGGLLAATVTAPQAHADPVSSYTAWKADNICEYFANSPHVSAVAPMFRAVQEDTAFSTEDTARVLVTAVSGSCPRFLPLLRVFAGMPANGAQAAPAGIGDLHVA